MVRGGLWGDRIPQAITRDDEPAPKGGQGDLSNLWLGRHHFAGLSQAYHRSDQIGNNVTHS